MLKNRNQNYLYLSFVFMLQFLHGSAQNFESLVQFRKIQPDTFFENVLVKHVYSDSLTSTFLIWIKKSVPMHYHAYHTEQVLILEGKAEMVTGGKKSVVETGDWILLPRGTAHSVKVLSAEPLKVLSIQAPYFNGTDRVKLE